MNKCMKCGIRGTYKQAYCDMCAKYGDKIFIMGSDLNNKHVKGNKKCKQCDDWHFGNTMIGFTNFQFPIKHKFCKGLIHLDRIPFSDDYSCDINLIFKCEKCGMRLDTWTEGETLDDEFEKAFMFIPKKRRLKL